MKAFRWLAFLFGVGGLMAATEPFYIGSDLSALPIYEQRGAKFTKNGQPGDAIALLRAEGMNAVRLRLFVDPKPEGIVDNSLDYTVALARRVKAAGLAFLLDLHYSDTWADPQKQFKPAAWEQLPFDELVARVGAYTREGLARFEREGLRPEFVQIGNEITNGTLWPDGRVKFEAGAPDDPAAWDRLARLLRAGLDAVPRGPGQPQRMLHIESGGDLAKSLWWFRHARDAGLDYDLIGLSYYPDWHGDLPTYRRTLAALADEFRKPIMVVEAGYPWKPTKKWTEKQNMDWPLTPAGQAQFLADVVQAVKDIPHGLGRGVWYWHPESLQLPGHYAWEGGSCALFDDAGELLPGASYGRAAAARVAAEGRRSISWQGGWRFRRLAADGAPGKWTNVELPHSPFAADLDGREHWFGLCEYERTVQRPADAPSGRIAAYFGAAMHTAEVLLDGALVGRHEGGYLPFEVDLTEKLRDGRPHTLTVRLDNRETPDIPPGKPYGELDFCWYGGLYRDAELRCYPDVHITDAVAAGEEGSGGLLIRTLAAERGKASVSVQAHVRNAGARPENISVQVALERDGRIVAHGFSAPVTLAAGASAAVEVPLEVAQPALWSPASPALHHARVTVRGEERGTVWDERRERFGIRRINFSRSGGFTINGERVRLRGTNRHQEFPRVGYAAPAATQRRDAKLIKEAGFDYVRASHYPPSPGFLAACDELGILVMNAIPGWQFIGGEKFQELCFQHARDLIRRDRNHPSVVLWELSLNETGMSEEFMARMNAIARAELPGDQMFTCGWLDRYDVYIHSRQHGKIHSYRNGDRAHVVAEYGDWEFYAANEGFDQKTGAGVLPRERNSRKFRGDGERGLLQQADNFAVALNDTLSSPAVLDGNWVFADYARGYDPVRAACGVVDVFRLPKFAWHFYRSQRSAEQDGGTTWDGGPMVFVASHWTPESGRKVRVFSNCEEVELRLNGRSLGRAKPLVTETTRALPHPPFEFDVPEFAPGKLEATGYRAGQAVAHHGVATPGAPTALRLTAALAGVSSRVGEPDVVAIHAAIVDGAGNPCVTDNRTRVSFAVDGATIVGPDEVTAEAGIATVVIKVPAESRSYTVSAASPALAPAKTTIAR
jgi:beta-galactosidase